MKVMSSIIPIVCASFFLVQSSIVLAHHWYPLECCSGQDCKPVDCLELKETGKGIKYKDITFTKDMIKPSQDLQCHVCLGESKDITGQTNYTPRCVFIHFNT